MDDDITNTTRLSAVRQGKQVSNKTIKLYDNHKSLKKHHRKSGN